MQYRTLNKFFENQIKLFLFVHVLLKSRVDLRGCRPAYFKQSAVVSPKHIMGL